MDEGYFYFGLELKGLRFNEDGDWDKQSEEIVDYVDGELNTLVLRLITQGVSIRTVSIDQEGRVND